MKEGSAISTFAAVALFTGVLIYAVLGGADYGAGFWDLTAGGARRGAGRGTWWTSRWHRCGRPTTCG
ncbi:hypothetical protein GCM10017788_79510 [Amycolatopsis acidiphila]|nr:hypothetical protein GCM10017788_79510 [Amycolatopsis acidiphila]